MRPLASKALKPPSHAAHASFVCTAVRVVRRSALEQVPTAVRPSGSTAAVLGSSGAASQHLSTPVAASPEASTAAQRSTNVPEGETGPAADGLMQSSAFKACKGLGGSSIVAAAFDGQHTNRAYALATNGSVLALVVGSERGGLSGCTVRSWAPLPTGFLPPQQQPSSGGGNSGGGTDGGKGSQQPQQPQQAAVQLAVLPGYLVAAAGGQLAVFNVTAAPRSPPRLLLHQPLAALAERFDVATPAAAERGQQLPAPPLLAASRQGQHVAVMLNATVLAIYHASFPHQAPRQPNKGALAWMQVGGRARAMPPACTPSMRRLALHFVAAHQPRAYGCTVICSPRSLLSAPSCSHAGAAALGHGGCGCSGPG